MAALCLAHFLRGAPPQLCGAPWWGAVMDGNQDDERMSLVHECGTIPTVLHKQPIASKGTFWFKANGFFSDKSPHKIMKHILPARKEG
ncbi:hypothetical protein E2562_031728 [Oryza meyeriana var. granulata]|uniref:Uncharacterized protein n=1 Tax=Oryza meyeriana var. granulata TaxID=110450 RepID=A0A6G1FER3_9ORYZ|nr:hypothetical protein E2562_031728 [Oryza meyeriana var. granulata]